MKTAAESIGITTSFDRSSGHRIMDISDRINRLKEIICVGDKDDAVIFARRCLDDGLTPFEVLTDVIYPMMRGMSEAFAKLEVFLPELMKTAVYVQHMQDEVLMPALRNDGNRIPFKARVVIGTCQGDIHEVGKSMVSMLLRVNGFDVYDLGTSVKSDDFISMAKQHNANIIAMSSMLTTSLPYVKDVIDLLETQGIRDRYKVVVGGAAVTPQWASMAGLDGFGRDAVEAVNICLKLIDTVPEKAGLS